MKKKLRSEFNSRQYMLSQDFEIYYYSDLHFSSVGKHSHAYTEVYLFCEGEVDMEIAGKRHPLQSGDVLVLPPDTGHRAVVHEGEAPYRRFVFWLSEAFCAALPELCALLQNAGSAFLREIAGMDLLEELRHKLSDLPYMNAHE